MWLIEIPRKVIDIDINFKVKNINVMSALGSG